MRRLIVLIVSIIASPLIHGQSPDFTWVKQISGTNNETPVSISLDAIGNIYTSGYFEGIVDFDPSPATYTLVSPGVISMFITKFNASGVFIWAKQVSTPVQMANAVAHPNSQVLCSNGDLCISGYFTGAFDFDPGTGNFYMAAPDINAFVLKLDPQGNFIWAKQWGSTLVDMATGIAVDVADAVYTTGFFSDTVDFDPGVNSYTVAATNSTIPEAFISKLDAGGNFVWVKTLVGSGGSIGNAITVDYLGNVLSTGTFIDLADFDPGAGTYTINSVNDQDIYVWSMDPNGGLNWAKAMGGTTKEGGTAIGSDGVGDVFVSGFFTGTCDFDPGIGTFTLMSSGNDDLFSLKLNAQGNFLWAHGMGGASTDVVSSIAVDLNNDVYYTGQFSGTVDFDPGAGINNLTATAINPFISKYDGNGNFKWAKHLASAAYASASSIAVDIFGSVFAAGIFSATTDFDPNNGTFTLTPVGQLDGYLLKLSCGYIPVLNATTTSSVICKGETATLTASGATTYTWNSSAGNQYTVSPLTTTNYTVIGKDQNGCTSEFMLTQIVSECTNLEAYTVSTKFLLYPNPNNGEFEIHAPPSTQVNIYNNLGVLVFKMEVQNETSMVSIKDFPAGIYFVETLNHGDKQVLKMVKGQ